jgi:hypothetical protein
MLSNQGILMGHMSEVDHLSLDRNPLTKFLTVLEELHAMAGHISVLTTTFPYSLHRATHLKQHAQSNYLECEPNIYMKVNSMFGNGKNTHRLWESHAVN